MMAAFTDKIAVVTGAASGMGRELAVELGRLGAKVAIADVDSVGLAATAMRLSSVGALAKVDRLDVTHREAVAAYAQDVERHFGKVNLIFNNAGIAFNGDLEISRFEDVERVMEVDFWGLVNGTKVFLPYLIKSGDGHVVNVSSVAGLVATRGQTAYCAAKFAVRGFSEALRQEMIAANHPVKVTTVFPGGVKTGIIRNSTVAEGLSHSAFTRVFDEKVARLSPEQAARIILSGVRKGRAKVLVGTDAKIADALVRTTGMGYQRLTMALARRTLPPSR